MLKYNISIWLALICLFFIFPTNTHALENIEVVTIDPNINTNYGTFQSHNQKVVANQYGIFMTHLHSRSQDGNTNTWRLSRSTDGGSTFTTIYEATTGTSAPVIETDYLGNLYLAYSDWAPGKNSAYLYRFIIQSDFKEPVLLATIPGSVHGKYTMAIDEPRRVLYFFSATGTFTVIDLSGQIKNQFQLVTFSGTFADLQYPYLYLDKQGYLYAAWTSQKKAEYLYWDIHFIVSKDSGVSWQKSNQTPLTVPVLPDNSGPTDRITLDDEFNVHTWLSNMLIKNNKAHFFYAAQTTPNWREHYVQYDLSTGTQYKNIYPEWKADTISIRTFDGFFVTNKDDPNSPLFAIGKSTDGRLVAIVSYDNGNTWHDYAASSFSDQNLYSIGGFREITPDGYIIGSYTDQRTQNDVRFFKVNVNNIASSTPVPKIGDLNSDGLVNYSDFSHFVTKLNNPYSIFDFNKIVENYLK